MSKPAITVENLSKAYQIGLAPQTHDTFMDAFVRTLKTPLQRLRGLAPPAQDTFWALKDVSFQVQRGEVIGIIGRNGAGKSTLLKVLSRITHPTTGQAILRGRVASLLEVGTGFHPELTGRENIYLNGAILGMKKAEIDRKFDEIVAFSEIEKFLDTPVKRYSSGMYVRLAFAVAAHLEPEILIVDEVLAVGDATFQQKCLGKMKEVSQGGGRTVLFVSHNLGAVRTLCNRGVLLTQGRLAQCGPIEPVVSAYLAAADKTASICLKDRTDRRGSGLVRLLEIAIHTPNNPPNHPAQNLLVGGPARFLFRFDRLVPNLACRFTIVDPCGQRIAHFNSAAPCPDDQHDSSIGPVFVCDVDQLPLAPGRYRLNVAAQVGPEFLDHVENAASFDLDASDVGGRAIANHADYATVCLPHRWTIGAA